MIGHPPPQNESCAEPTRPAPPIAVAVNRLHDLMGCNLRLIEDLTVHLEPILSPAEKTDKDVCRPPCPEGLLGCLTDLGNRLDEQNMALAKVRSRLLV